jgi:hypothetical protein
MRLLPSPVELILPAEHRFLVLAQQTAGAVAMACGMPLDELEDFRLLVDEICDALIGTNSEAPVRLVFRMAGNDLVVDASTHAGDEPGPDRLAFGNEILDIVADTHERVVEDGCLRYTATRDIRSGGVG